jgi:hypothetical protein
VEIARNPQKAEIAWNPQKPEDCVKSANSAQLRIPRKTCEISFHTQNKRQCVDHAKRGTLCVSRKRVKMRFLFDGTVVTAPIAAPTQVKERVPSLAEFAWSHRNRRVLGGRQAGMDWGAGARKVYIFGRHLHEEGEPIPWDIWTNPHLTQGMRNLSELLDLSAKEGT